MLLRWQGAWERMEKPSAGGGGGRESSCRERMGAGGRQAEVGSWGWNQKAGEGGSGRAEETEVSDYE